MNEDQAQLLATVHAAAQKAGFNISALGALWAAISPAFDLSKINYPAAIAAIISLFGLPVGGNPSGPTIVGGNVGGPTIQPLP